jgi:uroporphyrinogen-III decarboxylase
MSHHRTLTINLARIILAAGVALPASFGTSLAAQQSSAPSLAAEQSSPEDITLTTPRTTRGLPLIVDASKLVIEAVKLARRHSR